MEDGFKYVPARRAYRPLGTNVIVELVRAPRNLDRGGLILPDNVPQDRIFKQTSPIVKVLAVGPDAGDKVAVGDLCCIPIKIAQIAVELNFEGDSVDVIDVTNIAFVLDAADAGRVLAEALADAKKAGA